MSFYWVVKLLVKRAEDERLLEESRSGEDKGAAKHWLDACCTELKKEFVGQMRLKALDKDRLKC